MILEVQRYDFGSRVLLLMENDGVYEVSKAIPFGDADTFTFYRTMVNVFDAYEDAKAFFDECVKDA